MKAINKDETQETLIVQDQDELTVPQIRTHKQVDMNILVYDIIIILFPRHSFCYFTHDKICLQTTRVVIFCIYRLKNTYICNIERTETLFSMIDWCNISSKALINREKKMI